MPSSSKNQLRSEEKCDGFNAVQHVVVRKQQWFGVFRIILASKATDCALVLELKQINLQTRWPQRHYFSFVFVITRVEIKKKKITH